MVHTPALVSSDLRARCLTFDAVAGEPLGPKYPAQLADTEVEAMATLALDLARFNPRRRWFRRFNSPRRIDLARRMGFLSGRQAGNLTRSARRAHRSPRFAHGDLTARNVMRSEHGLCLIDWEWAGLYPPAYELAFLWFSLVDVDGGRQRVEDAAGGNEEAFLLSALLIQLWHLQWFVPPEFKKRHIATRDELLERLGTH